MSLKHTFVDNNHYATKIIGESSRGKALYLALVKDNRENLDVAWVKENDLSYLGVSIFSESPVVVREVLQRFIPGDMVKFGKKRMKTYVLLSQEDSFLLKRIISKNDRLS